MRNAARLKLGYYPLPPSEARRLRAHLSFPSGAYSALDPCVGDGGAFQALTVGTSALRYGIELDAYRTEQARKLGIDVFQADAMEMQCCVDSISFLYLNPPYDFEVGTSGNLRMEVVFLRHTGRWLTPGGVLFLVIPQGQLIRCAKTLAEHFEAIRIYRLSDPESVEYGQIVVMAVRRPRERRLRDDELGLRTRELEGFSSRNELPDLPDIAEQAYSIPPSYPVEFVYRGLPLDEIEDRLVESAAYREVKRILLRERGSIRGRPLTPLHGGHVGLLCTAGMLNGVFGEGALRHVANWQSRKYTRTWQEEHEGKNVRHVREYFSHECTLLWANGKTQVLTHDAARENEEDHSHASMEACADSRSSSVANHKDLGNSNVIVMPARNRTP